MGEEDMEKLKDLKAVYSGAIQCGEIGIANIIKSGIDLIEKLQKEVAQNYISKQKIKDKIKELKKKVEELTDEKGYWGGSDLLEQIKVLEEILEKEQ